MPSSPPKAPTNELGHVAPWSAFSGYNMVSGWPVDDEETPELFWPNSIRVYDRMRRQDAQVRAVYWALTLPLRRPIWALDPAGAREEVVRQVADDVDLPILGEEAPAPLRRQGRFTWSEHLRLALLDLIYGHMPFEQVYYVDGGRVRLRKLGPRFPNTLAAINVAADGGLISIEQYPPARAWDRVIIPVDRLAYYVNDREGASWQGQSILRAVYKNWLLKDRGLRTWAMSLERTGMGVPIITAPERATPGQIGELNLMAQNYRAGESAGGSLPYGATLELVGIKGNVPDGGAAIGYHDNAIARGMLTQFLQLGTDGNTGNRALVSGFLDFFALAVDGISGRQADTTTAHVIEDIVDLNWGPEEPAPRVVARPVDSERDITPEALVPLLTLGAIGMDDQLEDWLRQRFRLPRRGSAERPVPAAGPEPAALPAAASRRRARHARHHAAHRGRARDLAQRGRHVSAARSSRRRYLDAIAAHFAPEISAALEGSGDPRAIVRRFLAGDTASRNGAVRAARTRADARRAVDDEDLDLSDLEDLLVETYGEAYVAGGHAAIASLPSSVTPLVPAWESLVDWRAWAPGLAGAAVAMALGDGSRSLATLREQVADVVAGIRDTTVDRLTDALLEGDEAGEREARLAARLDGELADDARAATIAGTEANRAMGAAATDTYRDNGVAAREWVALEDPCDDCAAMDGVVAALDEEFPDLGDVPAHPNCRCSTLPVMAEEIGAA